MNFQDPLPAEWVHARAQEVVAGLKPEADSPNWLSRWLDRFDLGEQLGDWVGAHWDLVEVFLVVVALLLVLALVWLLVRELDLGRRRSGQAAAALAQGSVRERVGQLLQRAASARAAGQRLSALRLYFAAYVTGLSRRGDLEYHDAWTNQELVARGAHSSELRDSLAPLVLELDALVFGGRPVTDAHLDRLEQLCRGVAQ